MVEICLTSSASPGEDGIEADHAQNPAEGAGMPARKKPGLCYALVKLPNLSRSKRLSTGKLYMILVPHKRHFN